MCKCHGAPSRRVSGVALRERRDREGSERERATERQRGREGERESGGGMERQRGREREREQRSDRDRERKGERLINSLIESTISRPLPHYHIL